MPRPWRLWIGLGLASLGAMAAPTAAHAEEAKRCKGGKQLYQGKCLYPDEIARLKADAEKKRQTDEARRKAEKDKKAAQEQAAKDDVACAEARRADTLESWQQYVADFPDGHCKQEAADRMTALAPKPEQPPPPPPQPPPPPPAENEGWLGQSPLVWIGFGVGAAGFLTWGIAGGVAISKRSTLDDECSSDKVCPSSAQGDLDSAMAAAHASTVGMVVGFAGSAVGIVGLLLPLIEAGAAQPDGSEPGSSPDPSASPADAPVAVRVLVGPGSVNLQGRF